MTTTRSNPFDPANQHDWTSLVRPPAGYRLDAALGTSFSLDFTATTALLLALLDQRSEERAWEHHARVLHAVTMLDERVRIIVNRGQIHADMRQTNRLFAVLDRIATDVHLERSSFHPKVWVFKYAPRLALDIGKAGAGQVEDRESCVYRFICASRNLTVASTWEVVARLEGSVTAQGNPAGIGRSLAEFFSRALQPAQVPRPVRVLLDELPRVEFFTPPSGALKGCEFLWQWPGGESLASAVRPKGRTALVVSPFVRAGALKYLRSHFQRLIVVSRQEELDACWDSALRGLVPLEDIWVVKPEAGEGTETEVASVRSLELHAKLLFCDYGGRGAARTETWLGSANASPRGWGTDTQSMNCEAMLRFSPGVAPEAFLEQFAFRPAAAGDPDLRVPNGWIERYSPRPAEPETAANLADNLLDAARRAVAALPLNGCVQRVAETVTLVLTTSDRAACASLGALFPQVLFRVMPLGTAESEASRSEPLLALAQGEIRFTVLALAQAGAFLLVNLQHVPTGRQAMFVIQVDVQADPDFWADRRTAYLKEHLSPSDFRLFLRSILLDATLDQHMPWSPGESSGVNGKGSGGTVLDTTSVEEVLYACTRDRSRIDEVDRLVKIFEGTTHVDPAFRLFWDNFRQAVRQAEKEAAK